ncbi:MULTISPECIES: hypothetical protein [Colwellia]|uniref:Uncharacterized protein n=1 Tax=Colwellia marinimaniae TaxID=1513592 RepID=A0ABQ0MYD8_9GAMM|nr:MULTISPECIES: hypothetical protein [Colwellia]GAW97395.1 hypothetical protein MTCD1_03022 [Colwellia marinimaniae]
MNKVIKVLSLVLVLTSSVYLPSAFAVTANNTASTTEMLITLAETDPVLIDRLNDIALTDKKLLKQLLNMAESEPVKLERLLNLAERNAHMFWMIANIYNAQSITLEQPVDEQPFSTFGAISDGGIIQN